MSITPAQTMNTKGVAMTDVEIVVVPRDLYYYEKAYVRGLEKLAQATLLFHRGGPWTPEDRQMWLALTGDVEATTKSLCDLARKVIK
jgi:hypothetical protein